MIACRRRRLTKLQELWGLDTPGGPKLEQLALARKTGVTNIPEALKVKIILILRSAGLKTAVIINQNAQYGPEERKIQQSGYSVKFSERGDRFPSRQYI